MLRNRSTWDFIIYNFIIMKENKLIAEFMNEEYGDYITPHYHCNWNVMDVVEKCFQEEGKHYVINDALLTINEEEIYKAVVEFIKQHNKES